uniref:Cytochrome P450, family 1, subfamily B, polypeptide 1 n=1 Tax=Gouania willdenowi TaxID=441366 RepID=A0A8C5G001_GOUWI
NNVIFNLLLTALQAFGGARAPPGPFPWPLIGNAAQLGKAPHLYFSRMAKKYGNVFQIKLGNRTVVVLNGELESNRRWLNRDRTSAGRPDFASFQYVSSGNSLAFGTSTDFWKEQRRVAHSSVCLWLKLRRNRFFQPMNYMVVSIANTMSAVCFGERYSYEDEEFRQVIGRNDQFTQTVGAGSIVDVMPWLQYFPNPIKNMFNNFIKLNLEFTTFIHDKVLEHRKSIQSAPSGISSQIKPVFHEEGVRLCDCSDRGHLGASQDTLSTAMQWIVLVLVNYPELQLRLQQEVDRVVDRSRMPSIEDQSQVPYVMAFIYEVMRYTSFNTVVFINQWSVNHDPGIWSNPETFDPERFLDQNGELNKDLTGNVLIFSLGKRRCIGEELSKLHLFLFTSMLVHLCYISPDPSRPPDMGYTYGLTMKPNGYYIAVTPRDDIVETGSTLQT